MNFVLLGPPASGKGTCSEYLKTKYNFHHISMGNLLRNFAKSNSPLAKMVDETISEGHILQEELTAEILYDYLKTNNLKDNLLLDGYPRGMKSVHLLEKFLKIDKVIVLNADYEVIKSRILNRVVCESCGKVYSLKEYNSPTCKVCDGKIVKRKDDNIESLATRLEEYEKITLPVIEYYKSIGLTYEINTNVDYQQQLDKLIGKNL